MITSLILGLLACFILWAVCVVVLDDPIQGTVLAAAILLTIILLSPTLHRCFA